MVCWSLDNLKLVRSFCWHWLTQVKSNHLVDPDGQGNRAVRDILFPAHGRKVHLKGYKWIKGFKAVSKIGDVEFWAISNLEMFLEQCALHALDACQIEVHHQGLKQSTGIERAQFCVRRAQWNHINLAIRAFLCLEICRLRTGAPWFKAKNAIRSDLSNPLYVLSSTAVTSTQLFFLKCVCLFLQSFRDKQGKGKYSE